MLSYIDDLAAEFFFRFGQFFGVQCAQRIVFVAAADRDAHDGHAGGARFVDQAVDVATAEQFAEQDEHVALLERVGGRDVPKGSQFAHSFFTTL